MAFDRDMLARLHDDLGFRFTLCRSEPGREKVSLKKKWLEIDDYDECLSKMDRCEKFNVGGVSNGHYLVVDYDMYKDEDSSRRVRLLEKPTLYAGNKAPAIFLTPRGGAHIMLAIPSHYVGRKFKKTNPAYPHIDLIRPGKDKFMLPGNEVVLAEGEFGEYTVYKDIPDKKVYASFDFLESWLEPEKEDATTQVSVTPQVLEVWLNGDKYGHKGLPISEFKEYAQWLEILFASHAATDGAGLESFIKWSRKDTRHDNGRNESEIKYKWSTCNAEGGITFGTIAKHYERLGLPRPQFDDIGGHISEELERDKRGHTCNTPRNLAMIFDYDPHLKDRFRHNLMGGVDLWLPMDSKDGKYVPYNYDSDTFPIRDYLVSAPYNIRTINKTAIGDEVQRKASHYKFHPLKAHLESLKWDGKRRIKNWLSSMAGAEDNIYTREMSFLTLYAAIKRVYEPGSHYHYVLILQGKQGTGKSSLVEILAGHPEYFLSNLNPNLNDARDDIQGKWFVEIAEGLALAKRAANELKQFITTATDTYRNKYGRTSTQHARTCVFIATTNNKDILKDPTGSRRFCCVPITKVNLKKLRQFRDQMMAEAYEEYKLNPDLPLQLTAKAQVFQVEMAVQHSDTGSWHEVIMETLDDPNIVSQVRTYGYITYMALIESVKDTFDRHGWAEPPLNAATKMEIDNAMQRLDFGMHRLNHRGRSHRTYTPTTEQLDVFADKAKSLQKLKEKRQVKH